MPVPGFVSAPARRGQPQPPRVVAVGAGSPAGRAGLAVGDEVLAIDGQVPRDVIQWRLLVDDADLELELRRGGVEQTISIAKRAGESLGAEVSSALFDQVRTCDNHCAFCFIYQLPPNLRSSLYLKDDDYRLSFLYGNFTTLTRFTEADLERVVTEGLSPLHVSIHTTDPELRARMLRNRRGATSLRWLRALLDHGITVHGQVVVCPGVNDGDALADTLTGVLDRFPELATLAVVPLGVSKFNTEPEMRPHTRTEAEDVVDLIDEFQALFLAVLGRRLVHAADEYYLMAERPFPAAEAYEGFAMHEDGIGMARTFELELLGHAGVPTGPQSGFFHWVDGAPAEGYRAPRNPAADTALAPSPVPVRLRRRGSGRAGEQGGAAPDAPVAVLTGTYGARVLGPLVHAVGRPDVRVVPVVNEFFGGNVGVAGLMVGTDLSRALAAEPEGHRYLLPDVCLSNGRFLDGTTIDDLPRPIEVVPTNGIALRAALRLTA
jgi:putative radical SAM enzyme (TIGR03279 family)